MLRLSTSTLTSHDRHADSFPRAVVLVDVCGRLSRAKDRQRGECGEALFSLRKICGRFTCARTRRASIQESSCNSRDPRALPRQVAHESRVHGDTCGTCCRDERPLCSTPAAAEWPARSARSQRNTICRCRSPSVCSTRSTINRAGTEIIASGTSCRHQIADLTNVRPKHMAELLAEALV